MTQDIQLLSEWAEVIPLDLSICSGVQRYTYYTRLIEGLIKQGAEVVFVYFVFAKYVPLLALITKALRRKLIVITGGIDATWVPDIRWGDMGSPLKRRLFALVMRLADSVLPFSETSAREVLRYGKPRRMRAAYLGVDTDLFKPDSSERQNRVVTACHAISHAARLQKGIEPFVRAAQFVPEVEFIVHGTFLDDSMGYLRSIATPNVYFTLKQFSTEEYAALLRTAKVYVQASAHEGFGVSLAEAMASGCVPVVANRYAMPETVGDTGYVTPFNDPPALAQAIREAIAHPEKGLAARQRVLDYFTIQHRRRLLKEELAFVLGRELE